jgi:flagellin
MSLSSINTNIAAYSAQRNIGAASDNASASIARLSSGNRIVKASDDVAALATGTSLRTSVTTLKQALLNTSHGSSLLQIAVGALGQVVDILQRQKALSVQAGSGSLSNTDRAFLNQEFQALSAEIDRISSSTKFSSVALLNGNLSGSQTLTSNVENGVATNNATAANVFALTGAPANGGTITVNGITVTFTTSAVGSPDAAGKVVVGATTAATASNLVKFLNESTDARLANLNFTNGSATPTANVTATWAGGTLSGGYVVNASLGTATNITLGTAANRTIAVGTTANGLSVNKYAALGSATGTILVNGATGATTGSGQAVDLGFTGVAGEGVQNNEDFLGKFGGTGKIGKLVGSIVSATTQSYSITVGDITYATTVATNIANAATQFITLVGRDQFGVVAGGSFNFAVQGGAVVAAQVDTQPELDQIIAQLNDDLSSITVNQNRNISSFQEGALTSVGGVQVANFNGASANFSSSDFTSVRIEDIQIEAPTGTSTDAKITARINGETYVSFSGIGNQIGLNTAIALQNISNPTKSLTIVTGNTAIASSATVSVDLGTQAKADAVEAALKEAFQINASSAAITFQVGNSSAESLGVKIDSVETKNIYNGATLDISTQVGASAAGTTIDAAINRVISIRADVGALQSRFDFASSNLQTSIQNQDAARGVLLDTDVTAESTAYATAQVQLQAGIAVLAQANLLPQNLLKLIG